MANILREKLNAGQKLLGTQIDLTDHRIGEILGSIGYDFLWVEMEHTSISLYTMENHLIASKAAGTPCLVRVTWNDIPHIKRVLEAGPDGIIVPMVNTAEEAQRAIDTCIYPPDGKRGYGPCRAVRYGLMDTKEYIERASSDVVRFLQIESKQAVEELDKMCKIPYVDGFVLGPMDLSGSVGELGNVQGKETDRLIDISIQIAHENGKPMGVLVGGGSEEELARWMNKGVDFISAGADLSSMITESCNLLDRMKAAAGMK